MSSSSEESAELDLSASDGERKSAIETKPCVDEPPPNPKRQRLEKRDVSPDEEFVDDSNDSDAESESTDSEVEEEDEDETDSTTIVFGTTVVLQSESDGKYKLCEVDKGRDLKIVLPESVLSLARQQARDCLSKQCIPVFDVSDAEIARDDEVEVMVYGSNLILADKQHHCASGTITTVVIKVEGISECFGSSDVLDDVDHS